MLLSQILIRLSVIAGRILASPQGVKMRYVVHQSRTCRAVAVRVHFCTVLPKSATVGSGGDEMPAAEDGDRLSGRHPERRGCARRASGPSGSCARPAQARVCERGPCIRV
jgi:hypothetical protein